MQATASKAEVWAEYVAALRRWERGSVPRRYAERRADSRVKAALIHQVLKELGIPGVSVRIGRGTGRKYVGVYPPEPPAEEHELDKYPHGNTPYVPSTHPAYCPACRASWEAKEALRRILGQALPDFGDLSDLQTDYFDFVYVVH